MYEVKTQFGVVRLSKDALEAAEETNVDIHGDLIDAIYGGSTEGQLLSRCLEGADEDRVKGWEDYSKAIYAAAEAFEKE